MKISDLEISVDCKNINWQAVQMLLKEADMGTHPVEKHKTAFENSAKAVFIFDNKELIAIGRLLSDGAYQCAVYDVAVKNEYQGKGIGRVIIDELLKNTEKMNIILYATPGKEDFYKKLGFCRGKTCMIKFTNYELMKEKGFVE